MRYIDFHSPLFPEIESAHNLIYDALITIGNCVAEENFETIKELIELGIMYKLGAMVVSENHKIVSKACWVYSNLVVSTNPEEAEYQINKFLETSPVVPIVELACNSHDLGIKKEALYIVSNLLTAGKNYHARNLWELSTATVGGGLDGEYYSELYIPQESLEQENLLVKALTKGIRTIQEASLVLNLLQSLQVLFKVEADLQTCDSIKLQFVNFQGVEALDACLLRNAAGAEDEEEADTYKKIFDLATALRSEAEAASKLADDQDLSPAIEGEFVI